MMCCGLVSLCSRQRVASLPCFDLSTPDYITSRHVTLKTTEDAIYTTCITYVIHTYSMMKSSSPFPRRQGRTRSGWMKKSMCRYNEGMREGRVRIHMPFPFSGFNLFYCSHVLRSAALRHDALAAARPWWNRLNITEKRVCICMCMYAISQTDRPTGMGWKSTSREEWHTRLGHWTLSFYYGGKGLFNSHNTSADIRFILRCCQSPFPIHCGKRQT